MKRGDIIEIHRDQVGIKLYILAQPSDSNCAAISLHDGNRWREPIKVRDSRDITEEEMEELVGGTYTLVNLEDYL